MKNTPNFASALAAFALLSLLPSRGAEVSVSLFYDNLEPYGDWVEVGDYGYCWHPRDIDDNWRPYNTGNWAYTDAGWTWVSDEPYGWAVYHYGRWSRVERIGWVWVPDTEWAPAWVSWRHSDRYVGWAPLPPESRVRMGISLGNWVDAYYDIGPSYYSFVEVRDLGAPRLQTVIVPPRENITIINQTTNITNITYNNNVVINNGPDYAVVSRESAQPIRRLRLQRREDLGDLRTARADQFRTQVQGDSLVVPAPVVEKATADARPKKVAQRIDQSSVDRGWKNAGDPKQVEATRAKLKSEAKVPEGLPPSGIAKGTKTSPAPASPATTADNQKPDQPATLPPGKTPSEAEKTPKGTAQLPPPPAKATPAQPAAAPPGPGKQPTVVDETGKPAPGKNKRGVKKGPEAIAKDVNPGKETPERPPSSPRKPEAPSEVDRPERKPNPRDEVGPDRPERPTPDRSEKIERRERPERQAPPGAIDRQVPQGGPENAERPPKPDRAPGINPQEGQRKLPRANVERPDRPNRAEQPNVQRPAGPANNPDANRPQPEGARGNPPGPAEGKAEGRTKKKGDREQPDRP